jgi:hypothetical protein
VVHAHPDPRRLLAAAAAAFALMLVALALPPATAELDLRLGGDGSQAAPDAAPAVVRPAPSQPRWLTAPLDPPAFTIR